MIIYFFRLDTSCEMIKLNISPHKVNSGSKTSQTLPTTSSKQVFFNDLILYIALGFSGDFFLLRLATKLGIAGGAVYVAYDSGLLSGGIEGSEALGKAKAAIPPAVDEWSKYFGLEVKCT